MDHVAINLPARPPQAVLVCRARAAEARAFALAMCGAVERAIWLDVASAWDRAALGGDVARERAQRLAAVAFVRVLQ